MKKIIVGITGASGSIYAKWALKRLQKFNSEIEVAVVATESAQKVWRYEIGTKLEVNSPHIYFDNDNLFAATASGSAGYDAMVICPCSMGTLGKIANGISDNLLCRSADVILKEQKKLILAIRETPYNDIHIKNMQKVHSAGGLILPCSPSFYSHPKTTDDLVNTVIDRILQQLGFDEDIYQWGENRANG